MARGALPRPIFPGDKDVHRTVMNNEGHSRCHKPPNLEMFIQPVSGKEGDGLLYGVFLSVLLELHSLFCWFPNFPTMLVIATAGCHL